MNVYEFLSSYFPPPMLGFFLGVGIGFSGGLIFSKGFFLYLSDGRRLKSEGLRLEREDREKKRTRHDAAAQRRLESRRRKAAECAEARKKFAEERREARRRKAAEAAQAGLVYRVSDGNLHDPETDILYCPNCVGSGKRIQLQRYSNGHFETYRCPCCNYNFSK